MAAVELCSLKIFYSYYVAKKFSGWNAYCACNNMKPMGHMHSHTLHKDNTKDRNVQTCAFSDIPSSSRASQQRVSGSEQPWTVIPTRTQWSEQFTRALVSHHVKGQSMTCPAGMPLLRCLCVPKNTPVYFRGGSLLSFSTSPFLIPSWSREKHHQQQPSHRAYFQHACAQICDHTHYTTPQPKWRVPTTKRARNNSQKRRKMPTR